MQQFIITLMFCSITMSALALFFMAIMPLLAKRYSSKGRYYAWLIIVVGLIIPFRPQFDTAFVKMDMPKETPPIIQIGNGTPIYFPTPVETQLPALPSFSLWHIAATVWLVGIIAFLAYHIVKHTHFIKMAKRWCNEVTDEKTLTLYESTKAEMGISRYIALYLCPCVGSPTMISLVKPCILLPKLDFTKDELRFIFKHELVHHKRKDLWYKCLVLIATAIHWFNPVIYIAAKAINVLCEISCDTEVISSASTDTRQHYSETIIGVIKYRSKMQTALSTNFYGGKKGMKKRIFSIMDMGKKKTGVAILFSVFLLTLCTGFTFAANATTSMIPNNEKLERNYISRTDSLVQDFEKYKSFGVVYNPNKDAVYYNGERVKLFVDFKSYKEESMAYSFDLCYQDSESDSTLYLEAVKGSDGNIIEIRQLKEEIAADLLADMVTASPKPNPNTSLSPNSNSVFAVTMDATQVLENYGITAKDLTKDKVNNDVKNWLNECDKNQGAYILTNKLSNGYITYLYYNGGGRYPWYMNVDNDIINVNLYSNTALSTNDGYYLMYFTAPKDYTNINLYLDDTLLNIK